MASRMTQDIIRHARLLQQKNGACCSVDGHVNKSRESRDDHVNVFDVHVSDTRSEAEFQEVEVAVRKSEGQSLEDCLKQLDELDINALKDESEWVQQSREIKEILIEESQQLLLLPSFQKRLHDAFSKSYYMMLRRLIAIIWVFDEGLTADTACSSRQSACASCKIERYLAFVSANNSLSFLSSSDSDSESEGEEKGTKSKQRKKVRNNWMKNKGVFIVKNK